MADDRVGLPRERLQSMLLACTVGIPQPTTRRRYQRSGTGFALFFKVTRPILVDEMRPFG
jgi:hypothetical protein